MFCCGNNVIATVTTHSSNVSVLMCRDLDPEAAKRYREKGLAKPVNLREKLNQTYNLMSNYFYGMTSKMQTLRKQDLLQPKKLSGGDKS